MQIFVNANAAGGGDGSADRPFRTIQEAADRAMPGTEVLVAPGIYREEVKPVHAGTKEKRIVYRSSERDRSSDLYGNAWSGF